MTRKRITTNLKKFTVKYYFDGIGKVDIEAQSAKEAEELFYEGNFSNEEEYGEEYTVYVVEGNEKV